jgi:alkanesulfonate monooxygenase SsuD/methylene tetrahydromethanopterin reductase-like flavin-dependent oxidoreductase (luciferase family)
VRKLWAADGRISHRGKHYSFDDVRITPRPVQRPIPSYVGSVSKPSTELAARLECGLIVAPFTAAMSFGGLQQVVDLYRETCAKHGTKPGRLMCSYSSISPTTRRRRTPSGRATSAITANA